MVEAYSNSASAYRPPKQWGNGNKWLKRIPTVPPHIVSPRSGASLWGRAEGLYRRKKMVYYFPLERDKNEKKYF